MFGFFPSVPQIQVIEALPEAEGTVGPPWE